MSNIKAISNRLKSVKNIRQITQSMKMVSASKYARAEQSALKSRTIGNGTKVFYERVDPTPGTINSRKLVVAISSDKGLCGAVHSNVAKAARLLMLASPKDTKIVCVGQKCCTILRRNYDDDIIVTANEVGRKPPIFADASLVASGILGVGYEYGSGKIIYNRFVNVMTYKTDEIPLFSVEDVGSSQKTLLYGGEGESLRDYIEFSLVCLIYYAMKENAVSELSSRMRAMDNASQNATKMIGSLTQLFNRSRQANITKELIEIISGAEAMQPRK